MFITSIDHLLETRVLKEPFSPSKVVLITILTITHSYKHTAEPHPEA